MKYGFVVPVYNHGSTLESVVEKLAPHGFPIIVVDDGNDFRNKEFIRAVAEKYPAVDVVLRKKNGGKGQAMNDGVRRAHEIGLTHIFQIDSDGQHDAGRIGFFLEKSAEHPDAVICGFPEYDGSAPQRRVNGRKISNSWIHIVTLSHEIADGMIGFRIYPVAPYYALLCRHAVLDSRMGYDIDILVHLVWLGVRVHSYSVKVFYPADGISNFRLVRDNLHIAGTYARLFIGMLARLPFLIARLGRRKSGENIEDFLHWSEQREVVSSDGPILFLFRLLVLFPTWCVSLLALPVSFFYMVSSRRARNEARLYQNRLREYFGKGVPKRISPFMQILSFSICVVEKIEGWMGKIPYEKIIRHDDDIGALISQLEEMRGAIIIVSHLGNIELLRSLSSYDETGVGRNVPVTAIFETKSTEQFNKTLNSINPNSGFNVIDPGGIGIETISRLQEQLEQGGLVVFAADRTSARSRGRCIREEFLGRPADFPYGVFLLAALLNAPTYFMFGLREKTWSLFPKYHIFIEKSQVDFHCPRSEREERILSLCREFVAALEKYCRKFPYQWYNFFNFWLPAEIDMGGGAF